MKTPSLLLPCCFAMSSACGAAGHGDATVPAGDDSAVQPVAAETAGTQAPMLVGTTWRLAELGGKPALLGNDGRAATLELTLDGQRVAGFAGCNRMAGSYKLKGDSLTLGPLTLTRMACVNGMALEQNFVSVLEQTRTYRISSQGLELLNAHGSLARLEAQ
jgi:heat shock protein HslJ